MQNILPEQRRDILVEKRTVDLVSSLAAMRRRRTINMKRILGLLSLGNASPGDENRSASDLESQSHHNKPTV